MKETLKQKQKTVEKERYHKSSAPPCISERNLYLSFGVGGGGGGGGGGVGGGGGWGVWGVVGVVGFNLIREGMERLRFGVDKNLTGESNFEKEKTAWGRNEAQGWISWRRVGLEISEWTCKATIKEEKRKTECISP